MSLLALLWNRHTRPVVLWMLRWLYPIKRGRVMCVCWGGKKFNCNPRAIMMAMLHSPTEASRFSLNLALYDPDAFADVPSAIHRVQIGSLEYYRLLATSQFLVSNIRFTGDFYPFKPRGQYYILTGHGSTGFKRIEADVAATLPADYRSRMQTDTARIDLMLSNSRRRTQQIRQAYRYDGEVLECGNPRDDIFFLPDAQAAEHRDRMTRMLAVPPEARFVIYAPTFRSGERRDVYGFDTDRVLNAFARRFGGEWYLLISSHPNMLSFYREIYDFSHPRVRDIGAYDLQELLVVGDAIITDYSSALFDFAIQARPGFILARDVADYDRGFNFDLHTLPWPLAETDDELVANIEAHDEARYIAALERFNTEEIGLTESGHASEAVVGWMAARRDGLTR